MGCIKLRRFMFIYWPINPLDLDNRIFGLHKLKDKRCLRIPFLWDTTLQEWVSGCQTSDLPQIFYSLRRGHEFDSKGQDSLTPWRSSKFLQNFILHRKWNWSVLKASTPCNISEAYTLAIEGFPRTTFYIACFQLAAPRVLYAAGGDILKLWVGNPCTGLDRLWGCQ